MKITYLYSKILRKCNLPSLNKVKKHKNSKIGSGSNLINVTIGKYSYTGIYCSFTNVIIGNYCSIASFCSIGGDKHNTQIFSTSKYFEQIYANKISHELVEIGNDVWIGEKVFIKSGVKIGNGAIIGAHSVVTRDVPPYAIVTGVPAKLLKYRFDNKTIERLNQSKWWELNHKEIINTPDLCGNLESFLNYFNDKGV